MAAGPRGRAGVCRSRGAGGARGHAPGALLTFLAAGPAVAEEAAASMPETLSAMPESLGPAAEAATAAASKAADAAPAAAAAGAGAAVAVADAAEKSGSIAPAVVLGLSPILLYGIFYAYREKVNPNVKASDYLFAVLCFAVFGNLFSTAVLKFRFF